MSQRRGGYAATVAARARLERAIARQLSVALVLPSRHGGRKAPTLRDERSVGRLAEAVVALPAARQEITLDLRTAIDTLEGAGAVDAEQARRARAAGLGELAPTMAPERAAA